MSDALLALTRIISGGQTGVDRAALDAAMAHGIACGGWVPRGRRAEDGRLPPRYPLRETRSSAYAERTRLNVRDADATLILTRGRSSGGTALTIDLPASCGGRISSSILPPMPIRRQRGHGSPPCRCVLNVAGPRESGCPGIFEEARAFLDAMLSPPGGDDEATESA
ncbi:MAG: putative molybdenum carrier protein [Rhodospirillales bacterium]